MRPTTLLARLAAPARRLLADDRGGELMETAIVLALISVAALAVVGAVGVKLVGRWTAVNDAMP